MGKRKPVAVSTEVSVVPNAARALALSQMGGDMTQVEAMASSQAGLGGWDQYGSREYEDWQTPEAPDLDAVARANLGWDE